MRCYLAADFKVHLRGRESICGDRRSREQPGAVAEIWEVYEEAAITPKEYL
jgi:hypothetical protein